MLFKKGEPGDNAYLIEQGNVGVVIYEPDGEPVVLAVLGPGDVVGEMAIIDNAPRTASIIAINDAELLVITRDYFIEQVERAEPVLRHLLKVVLGRMRRLEAHTFGSRVDSKATTLTSATDPAGREEMRGLLRLQHEILTGIQQQQFELYYQPVIDLPTGLVSGFEALIRWPHPSRGMIPPADFIGAAELSGLIVPLGNWIFREACSALVEFRQAARQRDPESVMPRININLSYRQFFDEELIGHLETMIRETGIPAQAITAEITETMFIADPDAARGYLERLRAMGIHIALDDFGVGYTSLSHLHHFPLDSIKIDRNFVKDLGYNRKSIAIVRAICSLGREMGMTVVGEGVEEIALAEQLKRLGCTHGQGYLFARPLPKPEALALIREGKCWQIDPSPPATP
jgi:EAL domain-containing protein (putative c-di-GMP-specific phosphodiesterase class I)